jgi:hypothetical protein
LGWHSPAWEGCSSLDHEGWDLGYEEDVRLDVGLEQYSPDTRDGFGSTVRE